MNNENNNAAATAQIPGIEKYLADFREQMKKWQCAMPDTVPLVSDFDLGDFMKTGLIEVWIVNEMEGGYCGKYLFCFDGQTCPSHMHKEKLETFFIVQGQVSMTYDGKTFVMNPGDTLQVERGHYHSFTGIGPALILECSTPCTDDDDFFEDAAIPVGGDFLTFKDK